MQYLVLACEPISSQVNYLIDEADDIGKGANATVSLVHDYLEKYSLKEPNLLLHADNCIGQNKNDIFIQYLMWRIFTKRNHIFQFSFMLAGHTKFTPDHFFGLFKQEVPAKKSKTHSPFFAEPPNQPTNYVTKRHNYINYVI